MDLPSSAIDFTGMSSNFLQWHWTFCEAFPKQWGKDYDYVHRFYWLRSVFLVKISQFAIKIPVLLFGIQLEESVRPG